MTTKRRECQEARAALAAVKRVLQKWNDGRLRSYTADLLMLDIQAALRPRQLGALNGE